MQKQNMLIAAASAALFALGGCNREPETITVKQFDPMAEDLQNAAPVAPPPMIQASRTYRCRDNSLVYIDFYTDNTAAVRNEQGGTPVATLTAAGGNPPYVAEGYSISANADQITYAAPGKGSQSCRTRT